MKLLQTNWKRLVNLLFILGCLPLMAVMCVNTGDPWDEPGVWVEPEQAYYDVVTMSRTELDSSISAGPAQEIHQAGKLYTRGNLIFLNDKYRGIHIIDNRNPSSPERIAFIEVPGNLDMAVKGNMMYVDNAVDLVTLDITFPENAREVNRLRNVLPTPYPPGYTYVPYYDGYDDPEIIVVGWEKADY